MKNIILFTITVILFSCSSKSNRGLHELDIKSNIVKGLKMKSIEITDDFTKITFTESSDISCRAYPPGNENAFFIKDVFSYKTYKLLNIQGLSIYPEWGLTSTFILTFEKIPKDLLQFHVVEGKMGLEEGEDAMNFMNVVIPEK